MISPVCQSVWRVWSVMVLLITIGALGCAPWIVSGIRYVYLFDIAPRYASSSPDVSPSLPGAFPSPQSLMDHPIPTTTYHLDVRDDATAVSEIVKHYTWSRRTSLRFKLFTTPGKPHEIYIESVYPEGKNRSPDVVKIVLEGIPHHHDPGPTLLVRTIP